MASKTKSANQVEKEARTPKPTAKKSSSVEKLQQYLPPPLKALKGGCQWPKHQVAKSCYLLTLKHQI
jgi:hypothetical protein